MTEISPPPDLNPIVPDPTLALDPSLADLAAAVTIHCEAPGDRRRILEASLVIPCDVTTLWGVLTDYDHLADFIPNLARSGRLPHPNGGIRLEQVGKQRILKVNFSARVVLDMVETYLDRLDFTLVDGDFKEFVGAWLLCPEENSTQTRLTYTLTVKPKLAIPVQLVEKRLHTDLPNNLAAIYQEAMKRYRTP